MSVLPEDLTITTSGSFINIFTFSYIITSLSYYAQIRDMKSNLICNLTTAKSDDYNLVISLSRTQVDQNFIPSSGQDWTTKYKWSLKEVHTPVTDERFLVEKAYVHIIEGNCQTP